MTTNELSSTSVIQVNQRDNNHLFSYDPTNNRNEIWTQQFIRYSKAGPTI